MQVVSVIGQKGGSGKTTLVLSLAVQAERHGKAVLIADLDPQASATGWSDRREAETPVVLSLQPVRLPRTLQDARDNGADLVLIDTPARSDQAHAEAAKAADLVLIPSRLTALDVETIGRTIELVRLAKGPPCVVLFNAVPPRGARREQALDVVQSLGVQACPVDFGQRAAFADATALGLTAAEYEPNGKAATEIGEVYRFTVKMLRRLTKQTENPFGKEARPAVDENRTGRGRRRSTEA